MYNRDSIPFNLEFLPAIQSMTRQLPGPVDCVIMLDCAQPKRISAEFAQWIEEKKYGKWICIDHHLLDHTIGDVDLISPTAASTGSVVWLLLKKLGLHKNADIANLVYCTLTVDTGSFRYSNTTTEVFKLAEELLRFGADPWFVARNLEEANPAERFLLMRQSLISLYIDAQGLYASMDVTQKMLKETSAHEDLSDEFGNIPRSIRGVEVSALFREMGDGKIKVSLRSKIRVDVSAIAKQFGGGGHKHAAGCVLAMDLAAAKAEIETAVREKIKE